MLKFFFKIFIICGVVLWAVHANALICVQTSYDYPVSKINRGIFRVNALNLRTGSGMQFCVKRVLENVKGKFVTVLGSKGDWRLTLYEGDKLWVHKSLLIFTAIPEIYLTLS